MNKTHFIALIFFATLAAAPYTFAASPIANWSAEQPATLHNQNQASHYSPKQTIENLSLRCNRPEASKRDPNSLAIIQTLRSHGATVPETRPVRSAKHRYKFLQKRFEKELEEKASKAAAAAPINYPVIPYDPTLLIAQLYNNNSANAQPTAISTPDIEQDKATRPYVIFGHKNRPKFVVKLEAQQPKASLTAVRDQLGTFSNARTIAIIS